MLRTVLAPHALSLALVLALVAPPPTHGHGNALRLEYDLLHRLSGVVDPYQRRVAIGYDPRNRITSLTDWLGRTVRYEYGRTGDLVRVTSPVVVTTTEGQPLLPEQRFPRGRSEVYGYTRGFADESLNHLLSLIVAPEEARALEDRSAPELEDPALLGPLSRMENVYGTDPTRYEFRRVVAQRLGGESRLPAWTGVAAPLRAGGVVKLDYRPLTVPAGASVNHPADVNRVTDRNGNQVDYFHNRAGQCVRVLEHTNRDVRLSGLLSARGEDPDAFEVVKLYSKDGQLVYQRKPLGGENVWVFGDEDLDGDGQVTAGTDQDGDGLLPEDGLFAFAPGNGVLDRLPRTGQGQLRRAIAVPDARGDTRGGRQPREVRYEYEPIYDQLRASTDPREHDPTYEPQNGGLKTAGRYRTELHFGP